MGTRPGETPAASGLTDKQTKQKEEKGNVRFGRFLFLLFFLTFTSAVQAQDLNTFAQTISNGSTEEKRTVLQQIKLIGTPESARFAIPALRDKEAIVRATAAANISKLPADEAFGLLDPLLSDKDEFVRREAAYALGGVRSTNSVQALLNTLRRDKTYEVRTASVVSLGEIGDPTAVIALMDVLKKSPKEDEEFLRRSAARSIGQIAQIIKTGSGYVVTPKNFLPETFKDKSTDATYFPNIATPVLAAVLQNKKEENDTRREAAFALGAIGDQNAIVVLRSHQNSDDPYLAEIVKESLRKIKK
jgi:HEAT repeat protein